MLKRVFKLFAEKLRGQKDSLVVFLPDSEISRMNSSAGLKNEKISLETYEVLSKAVEFSRCFPVSVDHRFAGLTSGGPIDVTTP